MILENNKFPMAFAPMPIYKSTGYDSFGYQTGELSCYVPSLCYIISERKNYLGDDVNHFETVYEVVFGSKFETYHNLEEALPEFNFDRECINSIFVKEIDLDYQKMKEVCTLKNKRLLGQILACNPLNKMEEISQEYYQEISHYYDLMEAKYSDSMGLHKVIDNS